MAAARSPSQVNLGQRGSNRWKQRAALWSPVQVVHWYLTSGGGGANGVLYSFIPLRK